MSCANESSPSTVNVDAGWGRKLCVAVACWMPMFSAAQATPVVACKPLLSTRGVSDTRVSPTLPYQWKATMFADARHCATRSGSFEIDFIRIQEYSPDLQFTETFRWKEGKFEISLELSPDEAVIDHRIGFIAPCVCREIPLR